MIDMEKMMRQDHWAEGTWVTLADGNRWSFPPHESVPGYDEKVADLARDFATKTLPSLDTDAILGQMRRLAEGQTEGAIRTLSRAMAIYSLAFEAGSMLLMHNYHLSEGHCEALMPFNFKVDGTPEAKAKIDRFGPDIAPMCNAIATLCGAELGAAMAGAVGGN
jgi:hypothetical protein